MISYTLIRHYPLARLVTPMPELTSITDLVQQIRDGQTTSATIVDDCLKAIDRFESQIAAWVLVEREAAQAQAARLDLLASKGESIGPLHGIPIGIKDIINVDGLPTLAASPLRAHHRAPCDAPVVVRLKQAGAIILGKTVTTELACFDPPPTRNPWNLEHTPGGSSSGSAAAVALGMCGAAIGSQTGGSITRPASYCGVYGMKPSFGMVDRTGVVPVSRHLDHVGPIARSVADLALVFSVIAGDKLPYQARSKPPRLGLIESFFVERADAPIREATRQTIELLAQQGAQVEAVQLPDGFGEVHEMHALVMACGAAGVHGDDYNKSPEQFGPHVSALIEQGLSASKQQFETALAHQYAFGQHLAERLSGVDALVTPATNTPPPDRTTTGSPLFNSPFSYAGVPTVSLPCGVTADVLPVAIQLIGHRDDDHRLLETAMWCEELIGFAESPT